MVAGNCSVPASVLSEMLGKMGSEIWEHQDLMKKEDSDTVRALSNFLKMDQIRQDNYQNRHVQEPPYVLELLRETEWFKMTVPKDRLYALYGLTNIGFEVNYDEDYSEERMFVDFAVWALENLPSLALLSYTRGLGGSCQCNAPSWAWKTYQLAF